MSVGREDNPSSDIHVYGLPSRQERPASPDSASLTHRQSDILVCFPQRKGTVSDYTCIVWHGGITVVTGTL